MSAADQRGLGASLSLSRCHAANVLAGLASTRRYGAVKMSAMGGHKHQLHPGTRVLLRPVIQQDYWMRLQLMLRELRITRWFQG